MSKDKGKEKTVEEILDEMDRIRVGKQIAQLKYIRTHDNNPDDEDLSDCYNQ